jgi:transposase
LSRKRRVFGASFKAQVALSAVRGEQTTAELASKYGVHASQVMAWKKHLLDQVAELFEDGRAKSRDESSAKEEELYEQIGRLKMEVEWLKKKSAQLGG